MPKARLRGALFGCGIIAEFHLRGWARIPEVEIVAMADPDQARAAQRRDAFAPQARIYGSPEALLAAEQLDFVDILTWPWQHREHCLRAKAAGLNVICQKPLCDDLGEARALVGEFADYPKLFSVHENHVFRPWFQHVLRLSEEKALGTLRWVRLEQNDRRLPPQRFNRETERGVLLQYGIHLVDMIRTLLGPPDRVSPGSTASTRGSAARAWPTSPSTIPRRPRSSTSRGRTGDSARAAHSCLASGGKPSMKAR